MDEIIIFWGLAGLITLCSVMVITVSNPVSAAIFLVLDLFFLGAVYALQGADFAAAIQIIIYTGAILVLFLFVIMILNLNPQSILRDQRWRLSEKIILFLVVTGFSFLATKIYYYKKPFTAISKHILSDNTKDVALLLFNKYVWPFEIVSMLILLAIVGSISIAKKKKEKES